MILYNQLLTKSVFVHVNKFILNNRLHSFKPTGWRNFNSMSQRANNKAKSYVSIEVSEAASRQNNSLRNNVRNASIKPVKKKNDIARLLTLAKPEKWNLLGIQYKFYILNYLL